MLGIIREVTSQRQRFSASEDKFAKAFHSSPDAITISELFSGHYLEVNEGFSRLTGYSSTEAIGRSPYELGIWEDCSKRQALIDELHEKGRITHRELVGRSKSGDKFHVEVSIEPITLNDTPCILLTARDISQLKIAQAQVRHLAYHDPLTNLPNRALLMDRVSQQTSLLKRHDLRGALLFLDLDHFKHINDSLGHPVGDSVLRIITARLETSVRSEDTVARLGGDEFVVVLTGLKGTLQEVTHSVRDTADALRKLLAEPMFLDGQRLQVTPSIGMVILPDHGTQPTDLLKRADIALYRAKDCGRNTVQLFDFAMQTAATERMRMESDLRQALSEQQLLLHYQPKYALASGRIIGAEALVRWHHPQHGMIPPAEFIPLAESTGLVVQVGEWVLEAACAQAQAWKQAGLPPIRLAVNVSAREFTSALPSRVAATLARYGLEADWLELEITESTLMHNIERVIGIMDRITALGVALSLDDFGTGYSSLSYLKRFPIDTLKIDRSFTTGIPTDASDCAIASTIISIAQQLHHKVIAEGVETAEQLAFLKSSGCDEVQGYLFSRPLPARDFERALRANWGV